MGRGTTGDAGERPRRLKFTYGATCLCCEHFTGRGTCLAFPDGIPEVILEGRHDHRVKPFPGDQGHLWTSTLRAVKEEADAG